MVSVFRNESMIIGRCERALAERFIAAASSANPQNYYRTGASVTEHQQAERESIARWVYCTPIKLKAKAVSA